MEIEGYRFAPVDKSGLERGGPARGPFDTKTRPPRITRRMTVSGLSAERTRQWDRGAGASEVKTVIRRREEDCPPGLEGGPG